MYANDDDVILLHSYICNYSNFIKTALNIVYQTYYATGYTSVDFTKCLKCRQEHRKLLEETHLRSPYLTVLLKMYFLEHLK